MIRSGHPPPPKPKDTPRQSSGGRARALLDGRWAWWALLCAVAVAVALLPASGWAQSPSCTGSTAVGTTNSLISDCEALLAAKDTLTGEHAELNWSRDIEMEQWTGITIEDDRVTRLVLGQDVDCQSAGPHPTWGNIPAALGGLSELKELTFNNMDLTGTIPSQLGNLAKLEKLKFTCNRLQGAIPTGLGRLTELKFLWLTNNSSPTHGGLTGPVPDLSSLTELTSLNLIHNSLTSFPDISDLKIEYLTISQNRISGNLPDLPTSIRAFLANNNEFSGAIPIMGSSQTLEFSACTGTI